MRIVRLVNHANTISWIKISEGFMENYNSVEKAVTKKLSSLALALISRFARTLKQINRHVLSLQNLQLTQKRL